MAKLGRPPLYNNCLDFDAMCECYFEEMDAAKRPYTIPGICYYLGYHHRYALDQLPPDFSLAAKRARLRVELQRAEQLLDGKGNPAGKIFDLKNNFGWVDRHEVEGNSGITVVLSRPLGQSEVLRAVDVEAVKSIESCAASDDESDKS